MATINWEYVCNPAVLEVCSRIMRTHGTLLSGALFSAGELWHDVAEIPTGLQASRSEQDLLQSQVLVCYCLSVCLCVCVCVCMCVCETSTNAPTSVFCLKCVCDVCVRARASMCAHGCVSGRVLHTVWCTPVNVRVRLHKILEYGSRTR